MYFERLSVVRLAVAGAALLYVGGLQAQSTIRVGSSQTIKTVQGGIDAASATAGDTVLVDPGVYNEAIDFNGKAITVTGTLDSSGKPLTTLNGGNQANTATVSFTHNEDRRSVLSNFVITGGGPFVPPGSTNNGGVFISGASPVVQGNVINTVTQGNVVIPNYCHGIDVRGASSPVIQGNDVEFVYATAPTGALPMPENSTCAAGVPTGGISLFSTTGTTPVSIVENTIKQILIGPAITASSTANLVVRNNTITANSSPLASSPGSAFNLNGTTGATVLVQNLIYGNISRCGGVIDFSYTSALNLVMLIANNTIADNTFLPGATTCSPRAITQIYPGYTFSGLGNYAGTRFINNVISSSGSPQYPGIDCSTYHTSSAGNQPLFSNNVLYNGGGQFFGPYCVDESGQNKNIASAPTFANAAGGDYHLVSGSAGIDKGDNSALDTIYPTMTGQPALVTDLDGKARVQNATGAGCLVDTGAYELPGQPTPICATEEVLATSGTPSTYGQGVTFTATLKAPNGVPTGSVQFSDGAAVMGYGTASADANANESVATYTTTGTQLAVGSHTITGLYQPSGNFPPTSATVTQIVNPYPTTVTLLCSPATIALGGTATLMAAVTSNGGTPTGTVMFTENGTPVAVPQALSGGGASVTYTGAVVGSHTIVATYAANGNFAGNTGQCVETVTVATANATLTVAPTSSTAGAPVTLTATVTSASQAALGVPTGTVTFTSGATTLATVSLSNGVAQLPTSALPPGTNTLGCTYSGDAKYGSAVCSTATETVAAAPSRAVLMVTPLTSAQGSPVMLMATISPVTAPGPGTPTGTVTFLNGSTPVGAPVALVNGVAQLLVSTLPPGQSTLSCTYSGSTSYTTSTCNNVVETVAVAQSSSTLMVTPTSSAYGSPVTLTASVSSPASAALGVPTGTVTFLNGGAAVGTATLANGSAQVVLNNLPPGADTLSCTYNGSNSYGSSNCPNVVESVAVAPTTASLSVNPLTAAAGSPVTLTAVVSSTASAALGVPTGSITFLNGTTTLGTVALANGSAQLPLNGLQPGITTLSCRFNGSTLYGTSMCNTATATVAPVATTTVVTSAPNPAYTGQNVTLSAAVLAPGYSVPGTGTVTFYDGGASVGTGTVSAGGASFVTTAMAAGTHSISATFTPMGTYYAGSSSGTVQQSILQSTFTVTVLPGTLTLVQGSAGTVTVQLGTTGAFAGALQLKCATVLQNASLTLDSTTVMLDEGGTGSTTLAINTMAKPTQTAMRSTGAGERRIEVAAGLLCLLAPLGFVRRRRMAALLCAVVGLVALGGLTGCSESFSFLPTLAPGTYQVPITATDASGNTQTAMLQLIVTPRP